MTRKDYQLIADVIKATAANRPTDPQGWTPTLRALALNLSVELQKDNPSSRNGQFCTEPRASAAVGPPVLPAGRRGQALPEH